MHQPSLHLTANAAGATGYAAPNIALVKYWGKADQTNNLPAVPSLSLTLSELQTTTKIKFKSCLSTDSLLINGQENTLATNRVKHCLDEFRQLASTKLCAEIISNNNFPTGAGLASSASGFAALVVALNQALGLQLDRPALSRIARRASGSAARSLFGGFVELPVASKQNPDPSAVPFLASEHWPLTVLIAIVSPQQKNVSSTTGMKLSSQTSPYYSSWLETQNHDMDVAKTAIRNRDFSALATIAERSCLKMHALTMSSNPGLIYWLPATLACIHKVRQLRENNLAVFFSIDAGPQVKVFCLPQAVAEAKRELVKIHGVLSIIQAQAGAQADCLDSDDTNIAPASS